MRRTHYDVIPVEGLHSEVGLLLTMLDDSTEEWRSELGSLSPEAVVWQPFPGGHSIGALLLHITDVEAHWLHEVAYGESLPPEMQALLLSEETQQYAVQWPTPPCKPLAWYLEQHDTIRVRTREIIRILNDPERASPRKDRTFTLRWLLHHVITHEAYHGGQAVLLALQWNAEKSRLVTSEAAE